MDAGYLTWVLMFGEAHTLLTNLSLQPSLNIFKRTKDLDENYKQGINVVIRENFYCAVSLSNCAGNLTVLTCHLYVWICSLSHFARGQQIRHGRDVSIFTLCYSIKDFCPNLSFCLPSALIILLLKVFYLTKGTLGCCCFLTFYFKLNHSWKW